MPGKTFDSRGTNRSDRRTPQCLKAFRAVRLKRGPNQKRPGETLRASLGESGEMAGRYQEEKHGAILTAAMRPEGISRRRARRRGTDCGGTAIEAWGGSLGNQIARHTAKKPSGADLMKRSAL